MRRKISTIVDDALFRRTKLESVRQAKQISDVISEALESYLSTKGPPPGAGSVVERTFGSIPLARSEVRRILQQEEFLET